MSQVSSPTFRFCPLKVSKAVGCTGLCSISSMAAGGFSWPLVVGQLLLLDAACGGWKPREAQAGHGWQDEEKTAPIADSD